MATAATPFREYLWHPSARHAIPPKADEAPVTCQQPIYNNRHRVERLWARLKEWRAVAAHYEKTATSFLGVFRLVTTANWLRH